jgi:hypothetical protein
LTLALGHQSVKACQRAISSREFAEWKAYYRRNPFGPLRDDQRAGIVAAVQANIHRDEKRRSDPYTWDDFLRPKPTEPQSWQQMLVIAEMWQAAMGGPDLRHRE